MPVALVTGGARRLGREIVCELARSKWDVAVHYGLSKWPAQELVDELQDMGVRAAAFGADLSDEQACENLVPQVIEKMGGLNAVVNNASLFEDDNCANFTYKRLIDHIQINAAPAIVLTQALYTHLCAQEQEVKATGVVVNLLDQKLWNLNPDYLSYTLSKAALEAATQMLARELAPVLRVVGIAPGLTLPTPSMSDREFAQLHQISPLGRSSTAQEVAQAVCFVINNRAFTGTTLLVDGGQHMMNLPRDISKLA